LTKSTAHLGTHPQLAAVVIDIFSFTIIFSTCQASRRTQSSEQQKYSMKVLNINTYFNRFNEQMLKKLIMFNLNDANGKNYPNAIITVV